MIEAQNADEAGEAGQPHASEQFTSALELLGCQGHARLPTVSLSSGRVAVFVEERISAPSSRLGSVQRLIRAMQKDFGVDAILWGQSDPDAQPHHDAMSTNGKGLADRLDQPLRGRSGDRARRAILNDEKFVAA